MLYRVMRKHTGTKKPARGGLFSVIQTYMGASEFRWVVEAAGIEPASASTRPLALHA